MRHFEKSREFFDFSIAKLLHFGNLFGIVIVACGSDSVVECHLAKVKVAGPNPVSRSMRKQNENEPQGSFDISGSDDDRLKRNCRRDMRP